MELQKCYKKLEETVAKNTDVKKIPILVQEMIPDSEEMIIGVNRDGESDVYENGTPGFGHLLVFGKGGIYTEVYKDLDYALVPASRSYVDKALSNTKTDKILKGVRGLKPRARDKLIDTILAIQKMVVLYPEIKTLDVNPVLVTNERAISVDLKVFVG